MKKVILFLLATIISFAIFNSYSHAQSSTSTTYESVSSFDGSTESTTFDNTDTASIGNTFNNILIIMAVAIVILVIFRIVQGAVIKGTFDNIYDSMKGKKMINNAAIALLIFIFAYAILSFINPKLTGWNLATNFSKFINSKAPSSQDGNFVCSPSKTYSSTNIIDMLMQDEGNKTTVYKDSVGKATIGVGFNLERDTAAKVKADLVAGGVSESNANDLVTNKLSSKVTLTTAQIKKLLENDLASHQQVAVSYAGGQATFNALPQNIQNVLTNMTFNMGSMSSFVKLKAALDAKNYNDVAKEIVDSQYCGQVGDRCSRLANLASPDYCKSVQDIYLANNNSLASQNNKLPANIKNIYPDYAPFSCKVNVPDSKLEYIGPAKGKICGDNYLKPDAAAQFKKMQAAAKSDGINIVPICAYRTDSEQLDIWNSYNCNVKSCSGTVAKPCALSGGTGSNHSSGYAIDIELDGCSKTTANCYSKSKIYKWMKDHGSIYGFNNALSSDNPHWSPTGR